MMAKQGDGSLRRLVFLPAPALFRRKRGDLRGQSPTDAAVGVYPSPARSAIMTGRARLSAPNSKPSTACAQVTPLAKGNEGLVRIYDLGGVGRRSDLRRAMRDLFVHPLGPDRGRSHRSRCRLQGRATRTARTGAISIAKALPVGIGRLELGRHFDTAGVGQGARTVPACLARSRKLI